MLLRMMDFRQYLSYTWVAPLTHLCQDLSEEVDSELQRERQTCLLLLLPSFGHLSVWSGRGIAKICSVNYRSRRSLSVFLTPPTHPPAHKCVQARSHSPRDRKHFRVCLLSSVLPGRSCCPSLNRDRQHFQVCLFSAVFPAGDTCSQSSSELPLVTLKNQLRWRMMFRLRHALHGVWNSLAVKKAWAGTCLTNGNDCLRNLLLCKSCLSGTPSL